ncbi:outer membrane protein [Shewanella marina]|uniref:outer membrane protein n=1 Tax=Shewanella marina TaxID=487319 RepID=UPI000471EFC0|nr:outer membrane beta-barrel protein [Shewanella marina]
MKKTLLAAVILACSAPVHAGWQLGADYLDVELDSGISNVSDISLGAIAIHAGYQFNINDAFSITPYIKYGVGISDDNTKLDSYYYDVYGNATYTTYNIKTELDRYFELGGKIQYQFSNGIYLFGNVTSTNFELSLEGYSSDDTQTGVGAGMGYQFKNNFALELGYLNYSDADVFAGGIRYNF